MSKPTQVKAPLRVNLCHTSRDLLVSKATAVVVGITFEQSILTTYDMMFDEASAWGKLAAAIVLHILLTLLCAFLVKEIHDNPELPQKMALTYGNGIKLIPAWSYKDVISCLYSAIQTTGFLEEDQTLFAALYAVLVGIISASTLLGLHHLRDSTGLDKSSLPSRAVDVLDVSFALGTGYAVNQAFELGIGTTRWSDAMFMFYYGLAMTVIIPQGQQKGTELLEENDQSWPLVLTKTVIFLISSFNFVLGYAWDGLFTAWLSSLAADGMLGQLAATAIISTIGITITASMVALDIHDAIGTACAVASGMNLGWAWMDLAEAVLPVTDSIGVMWLYAVGLILLTAVLAYLLDFAIAKVEKAELAGLSELDHLLTKQPAKV